MTHYVGIDLGTTNSAICSYNGKSSPQIHKSTQEEGDVTPSAIYIGRSGNKLYGSRAYYQALTKPDDVAMLFKREMGTSKSFEFPMSAVEMTPQQCSAEILKVLFGYLPEEIRDNPDTGTVIAVPDAFDQRQKYATKQAAEMAGLGQVALVSEPVAATMSVMRIRESSGIFLIFDLGGGTLDIAVADNRGKRADVIVTGGIQRLGGRDFDRAIRDSFVRPWLLKNFDLPEDFHEIHEYGRLDRFAGWAAEKAKIGLSSRDEDVIFLDEEELRVLDQSEQPTYVNVPLQRTDYDPLLVQYIQDAVEAAKETLRKANVEPEKVTEVVFIGGPTKYKPLRDAVCDNLGIPTTTYVNPMTAVAEGASLYAESYDWSATDGQRKESKSVWHPGTNLDLSIDYDARTPDERTSVTVTTSAPVPDGMELQIDNPDTAWTSGRCKLREGLTVDLPLGSFGTHTFRVFVFDDTGRSVALDKGTIAITRVEVVVEAIHASRSIAVEVHDQESNESVPHYLLRPGDRLPKEGVDSFRTTEELDAEHDWGTIRLKLWEGDIEEPISDNRFIGVLRITGMDLEEGTVPEGTELKLRYKVTESGNIDFDVFFPERKLTFSPGVNFYAPQEAQIDYRLAAPGIVKEGRGLLKRIGNIVGAVDDPRLAQAHAKATKAAWLKPTETDLEKVADADDSIHEAKKILAVVRADNLLRIRQMELEDMKERFEMRAVQYAHSSEKEEFSSVVQLTQDSMSTKGSVFEQHLDKLWKIYFRVLERQDWHIIEWYTDLVSSPHKFKDRSRLGELREKGDELVREGKIEALRDLISDLYSIYIFDSDSEEEMARDPNIVAGVPDNE